MGESFDIGSDTRTAVNDDYKLPFRFTGTINKLTFKLGPSQLLPTDRKAAEDAAKRGPPLPHLHSIVLDGFRRMEGDASLFGSVVKAQEIRLRRC